jgi:WD40 repeat protein
LPAHNRAFWEVAISPDGQHAATSGIDGVRLWELQPVRTLALLPCAYHRYGLAFSPDGKALASVGRVGDLDVYGLAPGAPPTPGRHPRFGPALAGVAFSPDGRCIATAGADGNVKVWDLVTQDVSTSLAGHTGGARAVAYSPDGKTLAVAAGDGRTRLWDVTRRRLVRTLSQQARPARGVTFSHDGKRVASGGGDGKVTVWDACTGEVVATLAGHRGPITSVAFGPPRKAESTEELPSSPLLLPASVTVLASAGSDGTVRLWDLGTGKTVFTLRGHSGPVNSVSFSPDGTRLASGGADKSVQLWDVSTGLLMCVLQSHVLAIEAVAFSPDGRRLASAGEDRAVRVWDAPPLDVPQR